MIILIRYCILIIISSTINNLGDADNNSVYILYAGFLSLFTTLFFWFRQVVKEHLAGLDSNQLKTSYVYGMAWFIFSEVMFFAAFFGAIAANFSVVLAATICAASAVELAALISSWPKFLRK